MTTHMEVVRFSIACHYDALNGCLDDWCVPPTPKDEVPATGFVALIEGIPAAFAFIRLVEGGFGQLDGLTSNPRLPGEVRDEAIDLIVKHLINHAKAMNLKGLMAYSKDKNTLSRSLRFGFTARSDTLIGLSFI